MSSFPPIVPRYHVTRRFSGETRASEPQEVELSWLRAKITFKVFSFSFLFFSSNEIVWFCSLATEFLHLHATGCRWPLRTKVHLDILRGKSVLLPSCSFPCLLWTHTHTHTLGLVFAPRFILIRGCLSCELGATQLLRAPIDFYSSSVCVSRLISSKRQVNESPLNCRRLQAVCPQRWMQTF